MSLLSRILRVLSPGGLLERRNAAALADRIGVSRADATWILRRSREVGYPQARSEYDAYAATRSVTLEVRAPASPASAHPRPAPDERAS